MADAMPQEVERKARSAATAVVPLDQVYNGDYTPGTDTEGRVVAPLDPWCFYQCDQLGTPQELSRHGGAIAWEAKYKAWGELKVAKQHVSTEAPAANQLRFQGQYFDQESGLHYNRFRYYDPHRHAYLSRDPAGLAGGFHTYIYAECNPIRFIDPKGLQSTLGKLLNSAQAERQRACLIEQIAKRRDAYGALLAKLSSNVPLTPSDNFSLKLLEANRGADAMRAASIGADVASDSLKDG